MLIKLKSLAKLAGKERLVLIPLSESGRFVLGLNFFEDVEGGREARFVIAEDRYGELNDVKVIEGDKVLVRAEGVREDVDKISRSIKIEKFRYTNWIPLILSPQISSKIEGLDRGVLGYINYVERYGKPDLNKLRGVVTLSVEEIL
ncbi:hypothetical protein [Metallosphaera hakonensis]|uniref:Uncharacterized protein n=1 Tax=Metallosphaera hakonensis JCM 8857 = DSM 7519 TaxID=1293036 RepID=A0A2U9IWT1_9CREN|nr:hypothetical protein [Metallosphaera hakonensis]AWS00529.1 hypothetical protein DFR87_03790 [Metallosphaera hakonensis JCM 8857 = DSM 7519]